MNHNLRKSINIIVIALIFSFLLFANISQGKSQEEELNEEKCYATESDMRVIGDAIGFYYQDFNEFPSGEYDYNALSDKLYETMCGFLLPISDHWRNKFTYEAHKAKYPNKSFKYPGHYYILRSYGKNGKPDIPRSMSAIDPEDPARFDYDIVIVNGRVLGSCYSEPIYIKHPERYARPPDQEDKIKCSFSTESLFDAMTGLDLYYYQYGKYPSGDFQAMKRELENKEILIIRDTDLWGNQFVYETSPDENGNPDQVYTIRSLGRDGKLDKPVLIEDENNWYKIFNLDYDIVYRNGKLIGHCSGVRPQNH